MATENELIIIADLIVGLREKLATTIQLAAGHLLTVEQRDTQIAELEKKLADEKKAIQDLIAEADALRRGISAYRAVFTKTNPGIDYSHLDEWEDTVGSIIWPRKMAATVAWPPQPWHDGEVPPVFLAVPGIEWEVERQSCDIPTATGIIPGNNPEVRCRPANVSWEDLCRATAVHLGNVHCMQGVARMDDAAVFETLGIDKSSKVSARVCAEYHKAYSLAVEFLRPAAVTVAAVSRADLEGFRREQLTPLYEAPESRPFRFVDKLGRPVSWTFLDTKMPSSGSQSKAAPQTPPPAATIKPGAEFRQGLRPKVFAQLADIIWDDQRTPHFASRPVNSTWAEVQRRAAEILGREDCLAGRVRLDTTGVYRALGMTHDDRAKTDAAAVAYQKAYSDAVVKLRYDDVSDRARAAAEKRDAVKWFDDLIVNYCFVDGIHHLPISWKLLDPAMENEPGERKEVPVDVPASKDLRIRGGAAALGVLVQIFFDGSAYCALPTERDYIEMLREDGLVQNLAYCLALTDDGKKVLAENMKNLLLQLSE
jgi:hypothetical protein